MGMWMGGGGIGGNWGNAGGGGVGEGGIPCPGPQRPNHFPGGPGAGVGCPSLFTVGAGVGHEQRMLSSHVPP